MQRKIQNHYLFRPDTWQTFAHQCHFVKGDLKSPAAETYHTLAETRSPSGPTSTFPTRSYFIYPFLRMFIRKLSKKVLADGLLTSPDGWRRVILEKPFGHNETSARDLDWYLGNVLDETQIYRMDHFLGKETVQNMLAFRFANPNFEPLWNRDYIDHVQITVAEEGGIGTRAGYYDKAGVVRDMLQNHLFAAPLHDCHGAPRGL